MKPWRNLPAKWKLLASHLFIAWLGMLLVTLASMGLARKALHERSFDQLESVNSILHAKLSSVFEQLRIQAAILGESESTRQLLAPHTVQPVAFRERFERLLSLIESRDDLIEDAFLVRTGDGPGSQPPFSLSGKPLPVSVDEVIRAGGANPPNTRFLDVREEPRNRLWLSQRILDGAGKPLGYLVLKIRDTRLERILGNRSGLRETGESYLVAPDFTLRTESRFLPSAVESRLTARTQAAIEAFQNGQGQGLHEDYRGVPVLSVYRLIDLGDLRWALLTEIDQAEVETPLDDMLNLAAWIMLTCALMQVPVSVLLVRRVSRPLEKLARVGQALARGEPADVPSHPGSKDELGSLFASMEKLSADQELERIRKLSVYEGQEQERARLSRELHDGIGQMLTAVALKVTAGKFDERHRQETHAAIQGISDEIRRISHGLIPPVLASFGLVPALQRLCVDSARESGIAISFSHSVDPDLRLAQSVESHLYRIAQEALSNVIRHSRARSAVMTLETEGNQLRFSIQDDGLGLPSSQVTPSESRRPTQGLMNIRERVALLRGACNIPSIEGQGTRIEIVLELTPETHAIARELSNES